MIGHRPPDWTTQAACLDLTTRDRDIFAPADHLTPEEKAFEWHLARRVCSSCPVRLDCAVDALGNLSRAEEHTMRGGLTPDELTALARDMGLGWRREAQHGTRSRYVSGCHCDLCRDAHRIYEHDRRLWAKTRKARKLTAVEVFAYLAEPCGRGKRQAGIGQLLLFTDGLPARMFAQEGAA